MQMELNEAQLRAVRHIDGPCLVVAGAGTGKTAVIASRIARLISEGYAKPEEILSLTFTDKAAGEMLDRLDGLIGWQSYRVNVMTFHAFGAQLLQRWGHHLGVGVRGEVLTDTAKVLLLQQSLPNIDLKYFGHQDDMYGFLGGVVEYINLLQNSDISLDDYRQYVSNLNQDKASHPLDVVEAEDRLRLYEAYEKAKRRHGLVDYNDQILLSLNILQQRPNLAERLNRQFRYVLVDEYQDTNAGQDSLLRAFVPKDGNIFAVGDDDQAIYGFRGAKLSNILNFSQHFSITEPIVLAQNYRSTQSILDSAYQLIRQHYRRVLRLEKFPPKKG